KGTDAEEGVRVGEVLVRLAVEKEKEGNTGVPGKVVSKNNGHSEKPTVKESAPDTSVFVRKYTPLLEDVEWAHNGVVAIVINGEAITVVQNR
ncbi:hypothetical protein A2U01_0078970, partial [Trifolium medium]|nr:hypothetical protein [Trifolium medium]